MNMPSLVGRERELASLEAWLASVAAERGVIALVSGEPGIGKTRFLETAAARAQDRGCAVAWGRAWEVSSAPPYWPWIEALRVLLARPGGRDGGDALYRLLPELDRGGAAQAPDPHALFDAVVGYLRAAATREPIVIILDDLHAADPSSLQLAERVAPQLRTIRAALLGSYRDVEARLAPPVEDAIGRLGRRGETLALGRLDHAAVQVLVRDAGLANALEVARMIHDASEGNPLFVGELLKLIAARGAEAGRSDVPAGVRAVIRERLSLLAPATVALLQAAAVVGRTFGVGLAAEVAGVTPGALEEAIGEAAAAEVVVALEPGRYRFSHALVAETLASGLAPPVRTKLHRRTAETLARRHATDPDAPHGEIAHHWLAVGLDAAPEALAATERAAAQAEARVAFLDAADHYERAASVLVNHAPGDARRRVEYLIKQGETLVRGGDRDRAKAPCVAACDLASSLGDGVLYARAALAYGADVAVATVDPAMIHLLEQALLLLPPNDDPWRAKVMARLASARQPARDPREPIALAHEAIAMARRLGDAQVTYDVAFMAIGALTDFEQPRDRAPLNAEVARTAAAAGDRARQLRSLQRLAFDMIDLGDVAGFERTVAEYERIGLATGQPRYRWVPIMFRAMHAGWRGEVELEQRLVDEAFAIREGLGEPVAHYRAIRALMSSPATIPHDKVHDLANGMSAAGQPMFTRLIRAWAHARAGRLEEARAEFAGIPEAEWHTYVDIHAGFICAQVAWYLRHREIAEWLLDRLLAEAGRPSMVTSMGFLLNGMYDHELMRLAALLGRDEDVERFATSALALCDTLGAVPFAQAIRDDLATIRAERGTPPAPAPRRPANEPPVVCAREGEFWTVRGFGELCRIKDSRGMQMLATLIAQPNIDHHVLDLSGAEAVDTGDAGEVIDRDARAAYQERIRDLREQLEQAAAWNDAGRRERIEGELEALATQLASAYGIGGRARRSGAAVERARQNVRRRIADAMHRIAEACPAVGRHLDIAIRTGTSCVYTPDR